MSTIIELLNYPFMQKAIICGISISFCAALIGVILVLKRYSMIGHGLGVGKQDIKECLTAIFNQRLFHTNDGGLTCIYDELNSSDIENYFLGRNVRENMIEKIKKAQEDGFIAKVDNYE